VCGGPGATTSPDGGTLDGGGSDAKTSDAKTTDAKGEDVAPGKEAGPVGEAGPDTSTIVIGPGGPSALGEVCTSTTDCASNLACIPTSASGIGICDLASFGLSPGGGTCTGECTKAADCAELPPDVGTIASVAAVLTAPVVHTCADLATYFVASGTGGVGGTYATACTGANAPTTASNGTATTVACFLSATYCQSTAAAMWTCEPNNRCEFTGACKHAVTDDFDGCPSQTRFGTTLPAGESATCNLGDGGTTGKCTPAAGVAPIGCKTAADCSTMMLVTPDTAHVCTGMECACVPATGECYVKCATTLDCAVGKICGTNSLCEVAPGCSTNEDCVATTHNAQSVCTAGVCSTPCSTDHDCSHSSGATAVVATLGAFNGEVCDSATKTCVTSGCSTTAANDCANQGVNGVNSFCVSPPDAGAAAPTVFSAITSNTTGN
jgi:hypothetical protein